MGADFFSFVDNETLSVHIVAGSAPVAKRGHPSQWRFVECDANPVTSEAIAAFMQLVRTKGSCENGHDQCQVYTLDQMRIIYTEPPVSNTQSVTIVAHVCSRKLAEYGISEKLKARLAQESGGILIAGSPGSGKSTLAAAFAHAFVHQGQITYTIESPRDLCVPANIIQLSRDHTKADVLRQTVLLSRPDYVIFDEMRSREDVALYGDLRLSGIGLIGVIHANKPVDALTRMHNTIDLGMLPQVVDTVIFVKGGEIAQVLTLRTTVKVPQGIQDSHQARPVIEIADFETEKTLFELYSYGEGAVLTPVTQTCCNRIGREFLKNFVQSNYPGSEITYDEETVSIKVPKSLYNEILKNKELKGFADMLGIRYSVTAAKPQKTKIPIDVCVDGRYIQVQVPKGTSEVALFIGETFLAQMQVGEKGIIRIKRENTLGAALEEALTEEKYILGFTALQVR